MGSGMYYVIDLGRSIILNKLVFWRQNKQSYALEINEAGIFTEEQADEIIKSDKIKMTCSVSAIPSNDCRRSYHSFKRWGEGETRLSFFMGFLSF